MNETSSRPSVPRPFFWRRMHSIAGLWLVLYLIEHLLVNSQAALFLNPTGSGFIDSVNAIQALPFLHAIEIVLLGVPIAIHGFLGIQYLLSTKYNSFKTDGSTPGITDNPRNHAFTWQRITSWLLVIGIIAHVVHMRFVEYPYHTSENGSSQYVVRVKTDESLKKLSKDLNFKIITASEISQSASTEHNIKPLRPGEVFAVAPTFGTAELLVVRDTFKMPIMLVLYTLFVLSACFHAFNGLWTFFFAWGITISNRSQLILRYVSTLLMLIVTFFGLAAIWGSYII